MKKIAGAQVVAAAENMPARLDSMGGAEAYEKENDLRLYQDADQMMDDESLDAIALAVLYGASFEEEGDYKLINTTLAYPIVASFLFQHGGCASKVLVRTAGGFHRAGLGVLEFLVEEHKADVNFINQDQFTPLAKAAANGKVDHLSYLLSKGAEVSLTNLPSWKQPLYLAKKSRHWAVVSMLQQHIEK